VGINNFLRKIFLKISIKSIDLISDNSNSGEALFFLNQKLLEKIGYGIEQSLLKNGEAKALKWLIELLEKSKLDTELVVFDVGANVGLYTKMLRSITCVKSKFYLFEPNPSVFNQLKSFSCIDDNIVTVNKGVGDYSGKVKLFFSENLHVLSSLYSRDLVHKGLSLSENTEVEIVTVDEFCRTNNISEIDLLKIDVEGSEWNILKGAESMLASNSIKAIQFEFGGTNIDARTYFKDFYSLLNHRYNIYLIRPNELYQISHYSEHLEIFLTSNYLAVLKTIQ
jgi:FkbM family methyltransferase